MQLHSSRCSGQKKTWSLLHMTCSYLHQISQKILLALHSKYVQILFISHSFHCTILGLDHLSPFLDYCLGFLTRFLIGLSFTLYLIPTAWVELLKPNEMVSLVCLESCKESSSPFKEEPKTLQWSVLSVWPYYLFFSLLQPHQPPCISLDLGSLHWLVWVLGSSCRYFHRLSLTSFKAFLSLQ